MLRLLATTLTLVALSGEPALGRDAGWRMPLQGAVARGFATTPAAPYARGQRRGVDLAAPPGTTVRSACAGSVSFTGRVPGGDGALGVSVRCGPLTATHLGLSSLRVGRGRSVGAGHRLGILGPAGTLRLGARVTTRRFGYLDPLALMGGEGLPPLPVGRAPRGGRPGPRGVRPLGPGVRMAVPDRARAQAPAPAPEPARFPLAAWLGVGLLAAGIGCGALVSRRDRGRRPVLVRGAAREGS